MTLARPVLPAPFVTMAFTGYVAMAGVLHLIGGAEQVWAVAALMMVLMTITYPVEAILSRKHQLLELGIAVGLSALAIVGLWVSPSLIILAVFAHGCLDLAKQRGLGVRFYSTYFYGCAAFDIAYAAALLAYFIGSGG